jgi:hypothetical protein
MNTNGSNGQLTACPGLDRTPATFERMERGPRPIPDWIHDIRIAWALGAANTLELARLVSRARESLRRHGQWSRLWHDGLPQVPFSKRKADMLAVVGRELGSLSEQTCASDHIVREI